MKVSVVIPTHNRMELVKRAINSVINQTYKDIEIIVISDGSTDDTDMLLHEYEKKDERIKYIAYSPAQGGNFARNTGIKAATGEYVAFLDDDDEWMPEKIELQLKEFKKNPEVGLVYTGIEIIYEKEKIKYISLPLKKGDLSKEILINNFIGTTSSVIVKSDIFDQSGLFDEGLKALQDFDLWIRICQYTYIGVIEKPLVKYYNYRTGKQVSDDIKKYENAIKIIQGKYVDYYQKYNEITNQHQQAMYMLLANKGLRNNDPKVARKYLRCHFKNKPSVRVLIMYFITFLSFENVLKIRSLRK